MLLCSWNAGFGNTRVITTHLSLTLSLTFCLSFFLSPSFLALVEEIYKAQRERDQAVMARLRLANEERDEALLRAKKLQEAALEYVPILY